MDDFTIPSGIVLLERREADGLDAHVPVILRDGALYDADLDRFFLDLPLSGTRSRHSLRACGYDVVVWLRFLADARGKHVWEAERADVDAFHRARRREDAGFRISAASWNRSVASLAKLYAWGERDGLIASAPFAHRTAWQHGYDGRRSQLILHNEAYERAAKPLPQPCKTPPLRAPQPGAANPRAQTGRALSRHPKAAPERTSPMHS